MKLLLLAIFLFLPFHLFCNNEIDVSKLLNLGKQKKENGDFGEAEKLFRFVLEKDPNNFDAHLKLTEALYSQDRLQESSDICQKALLLKPENLDAPLEYSKITFLKRNIGHSKTVAKRVLSYSWDALNFLSHIYASQQNFKEAIILLKALTHIAENEPLPHKNLGVYYLTLGKFEKGFAEYEWRQSEKCYLEEAQEKPVWTGQDLTGKKILIYTEQGLGDVFQFIRYAKLVKDKGAKVFLRLHKPFMQKCLLCYSYIDEIISVPDPLPDFDYKVRLASLPFIFKTSLKTVPNKIPYLSADNKLEKSWKEKLSKDKKFKIGICWEGKTYSRSPFIRLQFENRIARLKDFEPIARLKNVSLYCLQINAEEEIRQSKLPLICFGPEFDKIHGAFMDTAAVMKNLDLVLTIDTSVAHLAGGLGVPVWVMLPYNSDWRWMLDRDESPWYPTMRLFRQPKPGDWESVVKKIKKELEKIANK